MQEQDLEIRGKAWKGCQLLLLHLLLHNCNSWRKKSKNQTQCASKFSLLPHSLIRSLINKTWKSSESLMKITGSNSAQLLIHGPTLPRLGSGLGFTMRVAEDPGQNTSGQEHKGTVCQLHHSSLPIDQSHSHNTDLAHNKHNSFLFLIKYAASSSVTAPDHHHHLLNVGYLISMWGELIYPHLLHPLQLPISQTHNYVHFRNWSASKV